MEIEHKQVQLEQHFVVELLSLIMRVLLTALAFNIAIGAVVLLLASNAQAATVAATQGTLYIGEEGEHALLLRTDVGIRVGGPLARSRVTQSFRNTSEHWREGIYVFPLPEDSAVDRLRIRVGERVIEGEIQPRDTALRHYQQARDRGQRTALVEQERPNIFTAHVANIAPGEEIEVVIEYQQSLGYERVGDHGEYGEYGLRFPMVVAPRYMPGSPTEMALARPQRGWARDTDAVPDASRISPPLRHADEGGGHPVSITVDIEAGVPLGHIESPHHAIEVRKLSATRHIVTLTEHSVPADRDFELRWRLAPGKAPAASLFVEHGARRDYALLMLAPPVLQNVAERIPRETILVVDTSGSMHGTSIDQAREGLLFALERLGPDDSFNLIEFNSFTHALFEHAQPATAANKAEATRWIGRLRANGGTEMAAALTRALDGRRSQERLRQVVFLTDGAVGNEQALFELIERRLGDSRLFTVGIGSAPNSHFMRNAARHGRGSFTYIGSVDEVREQMSALFAKLEAPTLRDIEVRWTSAAADDPALPVPDLYLGEPVVVTASLNNAEGVVTVSGRLGDVPWQTTIDLGDAHLVEGVGTLWARRRIDTLLDSLGRGGDAESVRIEATALALEHRLVSRYTSLVAIATSPARPGQAGLQTDEVPASLPSGWTHTTVAGELPRGATDSARHLVTGLLALMLAWLLGGLRRATASARLAT